MADLIDLGENLCLPLADTWADLDLVRQAQSPNAVKLSCRIPSPPRTPEHKGTVPLPDGATPDRCSPNVAAACNIVDDDSDLKSFPDYVEIWGDKSLWCSICQLQTTPANMRQHLDGERHAKACRRLESPGKPCDESKQGVDGPQDKKEKQVDASDLEMLPDYVECVENKFLRCGLCDVRSTLSLSPMIQHLCGEKHAKACRKEGWPEVIYEEHSGHLQELLSGQIVRRSKEASRWRERCKAHILTGDTVKICRPGGSTDGRVGQIICISLEAQTCRIYGPHINDGFDYPLAQVEKVNEVSVSCSGPSRVLVQEKFSAELDPWHNGSDPWSQAQPSSDPWSTSSAASNNFFGQHSRRQATGREPRRQASFRAKSRSSSHASAAASRASSSSSGNTGQLKPSDVEGLIQDLQTLTVPQLCSRAHWVLEAFPSEVRLLLTRSAGPASLLWFRGHVCRRGSACKNGARCTFAHSDEELLECDAAGHLRAAALHMKALHEEHTARSEGNCVQLREGEVLEAKRPVIEAPNGWSATNFLLPISVAQSITVVIVEDDCKDYFWGRSGDCEGWVQTSVVR
mmetsp:Transcript_90633/g.143216  ORF Transcript_90633/g.143216 Transcript_90633/m.143216 type:complete len:573 (-) Transcript_90633:48-1766(-)